jgi:hypothetical protein
MEKIIKEIMNIMGDIDGSQLSIDFYTDESIVFNIYEVEIPLIVDKKKKTVYMDCECYTGEITVDMLDELHQIAKLLEENIDLILSCLE